MRLLCDDQVDIWLISWTEEQGTQLHDHGGSSGAFTVVTDGTVSSRHRLMRARPQARSSSIRPVWRHAADGEILGSVIVERSDIIGGIRGWRTAGLPVVPGPTPVEHQVAAAP